MSTIYKNFDFNPVNVSRKTTSYTIPEGRYAFISYLAGYLSINGTFLDAIFSQSGLVGTVTTFTGTPNVRNLTLDLFLNRASGVGSKVFQVGGVTISSGPEGAQSFLGTPAQAAITAPTDWLSITQSGVSTYNYQVVFFPIERVSRWVPEGSILTPRGSQNVDTSHYWVTEYNMYK